MADIVLDRVLKIQVSSTVDFSSYTQVDNIVAGTMAIEEILTEKDLSFGNIYASKLEVTLYDVSDISGKYIKVTAEEGNNVIPLFFGMVDSCKKDRQGFTTDIIAYDMAYTYSKINCSWYWYDLWYLIKPREGTFSIQEMRELLLDAYGIPYDKGVTYPNDDIQIRGNIQLTSVSVLSMISMLSALTCRYPHFDRTGKLEFIELGNPNDTSINIENLYEGENASFEERPTKLYTNVQLYDVNNNLLYDTDDGWGLQAASNPYTVSNNILIQSLTGEENKETLQSIAETLLAALQNIRYTPAEVPLIASNFALELGQKVSTSRGYFYILKNSLSNSLLVDETLVAEGVKEDNQTAVETKFGDAVFYQNIQDVIGQESSLDFRVKVYTNALRFDLADGVTSSIISATMTSTSQTQVVIDTEILVDVSPTEEGGVAKLIFSYYYDDVVIDRYPTETLEEGKHIINLHFTVSVTSTIAHRFQVRLTTDGGRVSIGKDDLLMTIIGAALAAEDPWDGTITINEEFTPVSLEGNMSVTGMIAHVLVDSNLAQRNKSISETFSPVALQGNLSVGEITANINFGVVQKQFIANVDNVSFAPRYVEYSSTALVLNNDYSYTSESDTIDNGYLSKVEIDTTEFNSIQTINIV